MQTELKQQIIALLDSKCKEFTPSDYISIDDDFSTFDDIRELIDNNGGFNIEIIYYANAIKFLATNDPSLQESLAIAAEFGFETQSLNSEVLASLLASSYARDEFEELQNEVEELISEFEEIDNN